jgi:para-nitrobenzyl esterase
MLDGDWSSDVCSSDLEVILDQPSQLLAEGDFTDVPVVLGTNTDEGALFVKLGYSGIDEAGYLAVLQDNVGDFADEVLAVYSPDEYGSVENAMTAALTDGVFRCPTRRLARDLAAAGRDVFMYSFAHAIDFPLVPNAGAFHGSEIPFVFGNGAYGLDLTEEERGLSAEMQGYWTSFAADSDPNRPDATIWPTWTDAGRDHIVFDLPLPLETGRDLQGEQCDLWDTIPLR